MFVMRRAVMDGKMGLQKEMDVLVEEVIGGISVNIKHLRKRNVMGTEHHMDTDNVCAMMDIRDSIAMNEMKMPNPVESFMIMRVPVFYEKSTAKRGVNAYPVGAEMIVEQNYNILFPDIQKNALLDARRFFMIRKLSVLLAYFLFFILSNLKKILNSS